MVKESALRTICNCVSEIYQSGGNYRRFEVIRADMSNGPTCLNNTCWSITLKDVTTDELPLEAEMDLLTDLAAVLANRYSIGYHFRIVYFNIDNNNSKEYNLSLVTYEDNSEGSSYKGFDYVKPEQSE